MLLIIGALLQQEEGSNSSEDWFAIRHIEIVGDLKYATKTSLQSDYISLLGRNLLSLSLSDTLDVALSSEWVKSAEVRKVWPNTLQLLVYEHTPLAYWRDGQLISTTADIFTPQSVPELPLTRLNGPDDSSDIVLDQFGLISQVLSSTSLRVAQLTLEARGAWHLTFTNGITVKLGRDEIIERLQRFIAVYESDLSGRIETIHSVDARYPHGVAVSWRKNL
ncbi:cell division protein FtsQ/DivIB [Marinomonas algarum]|uniref:cell division protein FtsQ/DivIB n=1 Tax=Marinomonas algarum TaxID=2883105 RepID=UPI001D001642